MGAYTSINLVFIGSGQNPFLTYYNGNDFQLRAGNVFILYNPIGWVGLKQDRR